MPNRHLWLFTVDDGLHYSRCGWQLLHCGCASVCPEQLRYHKLRWTYDRLIRYCRLE